MTHDQIIDLWPSLSAFAEDIAVSYGTAKAMRRRSSVPACHWANAVAKAQSRGLCDVTLEAFAAGIKTGPAPNRGEAA